MITEFDRSMAESVHRESLDEDNRRFVPQKCLKPWKKPQKRLDF